MANEQLIGDDSPDAAQAQLAIKEQMLALWQMLPSAHQASLALVLVNTLSTEHADWLHEALGRKQPTTLDALPPAFGRFRLRPHDLQRLGLAREDVARLDETALDAIAQAVRDHYVTDFIWSEVAYHAWLWLSGPPNEHP